MDARVAVVVLNWNGAPDTIRCVESLHALACPPTSIVVIDNGSTDDSIPRIRAAYPRVSLIETGENLGFAAGCNVGIRHAFEEDYEFVWLLNNDTVVAPMALTAMVQTARAREDVGAVGSVLRFMSEPSRVQTWGGGWHHPYLGAGINWTGPVPAGWVRYLVGASMLLRTEALRDVGLLDERFFMYREDTDLCVRLQKSGWLLRVAADSVVYHAVGGSSSGGAVRDQWIADSAVRYYRKQSPVPLFSLAVETTGKMVARAFRGEWHRVRAVWSGTLRALRRSGAEPLADH
jgi:GT2 family glycosyltransferase